MISLGWKAPEPTLQKYFNPFTSIDFEELFRYLFKRIIEAYEDEMEVLYKWAK